MKRISLFFAIVAAGTLIGSPISGRFGVWRDEVALAENTSVEKAVQDVRDRVDNLVTSKDEGATESLSLRIEAFKKVLDLSLAEAKDLKLKILAIEIKDDKALSTWKNAMLDALSATLSFYESQQGSLIDQDINSIEKIKTIAEEFKAWREEHYLLITNQVNDFLLIGQEGKAIATAQKRAKKINEDVQKLSGIKKNADLVGLFKKAEEAIIEAVNLNRGAADSFREKYVAQYEEKPEAVPQINAQEEATSSPSSTTSHKLESGGLGQSESTSSATSTVPNTSAGEAVLHPSIRDLVKSSLMKVKETYQAFIEMGNFVRKLLS